MPTTTRSRRHMHTEDLILSFGPTATVGAGELEQPGLAPTATILALSTGLYYDDTGPPYWVAAPVLVAMPVVDAAMPDFYAAAAILPANMDIATVGRDLMVKYEDKSTPDPFTEFEHITLFESEMDRLETDHTIVGSFGEGMKVISSLMFRNYIQYDHVHNAAGQLTACKIRVYAVAADMAGFPGGDTPLYTYNWTTSYAAGLPDVSSCS